MQIDRKVNLIIEPLLKSLIFKKTLSQEDLKTVLDITIQKVVHTIHAQAITLFLLGEDDRIHFSYVYFSPNLYRGNKELERIYVLKKKNLEKLSLEKGSGIVGRVISTGQKSVSLDVKKDPDFYGEVDMTGGFVTKSMITVPLKTDRVIGAIQVINKEEETGTEGSFFTREDVYLLEEVAGYSAKIIQKVNFPDIEFSEKELASYVAQLTKHPYIELGSDFKPDPELMGLVGPENLKRYQLFPLKKLGEKELRVVLSNPLDYQTIESFEYATRLRAKEIVVSSRSEILKIIDNYLASIGMKRSDTLDVTEKVREQYETVTETEKIQMEGERVDEDSAPIIQLANQLIEEAFAKGASDIHVEPFEDAVVVRYRVDGILKEYHKLPRQAHGALVARYKIMSSLNIAERRLPQDGRIKFKNFSRNKVDIELRVSTAPMAWGEKVVMRLLDKSGTMLGMDKLGFSERNLQIYRDLIKKPFGMILNVGPTGSGKTSTLYSALHEINKPEINIQTAEDPVEYMLRGINQLQVRHDIGLTFAQALRSFLRQDPDIIMVGEIRDLETAEVAIEAALTGHLLFSTLHTNDAATTVTRFIDMGVEPFLVSSTLLGVCAQRLLRRLCDCKESYVPSPEEASASGIPTGFTFYRPKGCDKCDGVGYKGRLGVHEILTLNEEIKTLINKKASSEEINRAALNNGMVSLFQDGLNKALAGITSLSEVFRVLRAE